MGLIRETQKLASWKGGLMKLLTGYIETSANLLEWQTYENMKKTNSKQYSIWLMNALA